MEINRFISPDYLWNLHYDAEPSVLESEIVGNVWRFKGIHIGYIASSCLVGIRRTIEYQPNQHTLEIFDELSGKKDHEVVIPYYLAPDITVKIGPSKNSFLLCSADSNFLFNGPEGDDWDVFVEATEISPSYDVRLPANKIILKYKGLLPQQARVVLQPYIGEDGDS